MSAGSLQFVVELIANLYWSWRLLVDRMWDVSNAAILPCTLAQSEKAYPLILADAIVALRVRMTQRALLDGERVSHLKLGG